MKKSDRLWNLIAFLIFAPMFFIVAISMRFSKFFLFIGGTSFVGFLFCLFIAPLFVKLDSYYESNKQKKYRIVTMVFLTMIGALSGIFYLGPESTGLFPSSKNDFSYSLCIFGSLGFLVGYAVSRFIKIKQKKYEY